MIEVLQSPYVTAARAKGLPERVVVLRHALRNALLPTITVLALDFGRLMGGIVVVETVFAYPGLGRLLVFSIQKRDLPTLQAAILVVAAIYAFANLRPICSTPGSIQRSAMAAVSLDERRPAVRHAAPPRRPVPAAQGRPRHRRHHRPARPARALDRARIPGTRSRCARASCPQRHLLARHRRIRPRRAEPAADGHAALACHGRRARRSSASPSACRSGSPPAISAAGSTRR